MRPRKGWQTMRRNVFVWAFLSIALVLFLSMGGCGGGTPTSPIASKGKPAAEKKEPMKVVEKKEPEKPVEPEYAYNPKGKPDPFKPFIQLTPIRGSTVPLTPLQRYEISQLKLVAIIASPDGNVAMVEDAAGKGFFLRRGVAIGKNDGKVTKVLRDRVVIEEVYQDIFGQTKSNEVILTLQKPEEGGES